MQSPSELLREKVISILAHPTLGINPTFVAECQARKVLVPLPSNATDQTAPFNFTGNSATFFRMKEDIGWLEQNSEQQYPCLVVSALSATQDNVKRIDGVKFWGMVTTEIRAYLAWSIQQPPPNNNFEVHLDALEQAFMTTLNRDFAAYAPALYRNMLSFPQRLPIVSANNNMLVRRGLVAQITARVYQF